MVRLSILLLASVLLTSTTCIDGLRKKKRMKGGKGVGKKSGKKIDGSCFTYGCNVSFTQGRPCQCNADCGRYDNCCSDFDKCKAVVPSTPTTPEPAPLPPPAPSGSCASFGCGIAYDRRKPCQCNDRCSKYNNCCSDYDDTCSADATPAPAPVTPAPAPVPRDSCATIGCGTSYDKRRPCQCNDNCARYNNCCSDYNSKCSSSSPAPNPPPGPPPGPLPTFAPTPAGEGAEKYWAGVDTSSKSAVTTKIRSKVTKLKYGDLWNFYKAAWSDLPGKCQGSLFEIYSEKCWSLGTEQCGTYKREGDCYNREHSWPKSWWGGGQVSAYSDVFHVMPSDGYVNGRRSSHPFGEVATPSYTSSEGHMAGSCRTPGYSGTCFEPTDRTKGVVARGHLYMSTRYAGQLGGGSAAVNGASMEDWTKDLILRWHAEHPPEEWEREWNNRAEQWQGNRNPYIDFPELAVKFFG